MARSNNFYMLEVKVMGLLMFPFHKSRIIMTFPFPEWKKVKSHVVSCSTTPLTKNKQKHTERQQILFHSYLVSLQYSLGQVSVLSSHSTALQLPEQDMSPPMRGAYEDRLEAKPVWQISHHMTEQRWCSYWLLREVTRFSSCQTCKEPLRTKALCVVNMFQQRELDRKFKTALLHFCLFVREGFHFS